MLDILMTENNKTVCSCKYCGWECLPWSQGTFYETVDWTKKTRTVRTYCRHCMTIDSIEYKDYDNFDHPLLIEHKEKLKEEREKRKNRQKNINI